MSGALIASTLAGQLTQAAQYVAGKALATNDIMTPPTGAQPGDLGIVFGRSGLVPSPSWTQTMNSGGFYGSFKLLSAADFTVTQRATSNTIGYGVYRFSPNAKFVSGTGFVKDQYYNGVAFLALNRASAPAGTIQRIVTADGSGMLYDILFPATYPDNANYGGNIAIELLQQ